MADLKGRTEDTKDKVVGEGKEAYGKATNDKSKRNRRQSSIFRCRYQRKKHVTSAMTSKKALKMSKKNSPKKMITANKYRCLSWSSQ